MTSVLVILYLGLKSDIWYIYIIIIIYKNYIKHFNSSDLLRVAERQLVNFIWDEDGEVSFKNFSQGSAI